LKDFSENSNFKFNFKTVLR